MVLARLSTQMMVNVLEKVLQVRIHADGVGNIPNGPALFVVNHFTRLETFILPYVLYKYAGIYGASLADSSLFGGALGKYLRANFTIPTNEPGRNRIIIGDMMCGRHSWIIYPEGSMIKNKKTFQDGEFLLDVPDRNGPPHTGAAVLALKAELTKRCYWQALKKGDHQTAQAIEERYHFTSPADISEQSLPIVPVNISYYPMRPGDNAISRLAKWIHGGLPSRIEEELQIEGNMLCSPTDISIYFDTPVDTHRYVQPWYGLSKRMLPLMSDQKRCDLLVASQRTRLTKRFMKSIYRKVAVNFDHIFCMSLRKSLACTVSRDHILRSCFVSAHKIRDLDDRRTHPSLSHNLIHLLTQDTFEPFTSIFECAKNEELIQEDGYHTWHINRAIQQQQHYGFHDIRLRHPTGVIANEIEALPKTCSIIDTTVNASDDHLRAETAATIFTIDNEDFSRDYDSYYHDELSVSRDQGRPFHMHNDQHQTGIILSHGYMAAPGEMRELALHLFKHGYNVYGVRLKGHGTAPQNLESVSWHDWYSSYLRGLAVLRQQNTRIIAGGFSMGGLLALLCTARHPTLIDGTFCINSPMKLMDPMSVFVPAVALWNKVMSNFDNVRMDYVSNEPEFPDTNYKRNSVHGLNELDTLITTCKDELPHITQPCCIIQADKDPTVKPESADIINDGISSEQKYRHVLNHKRHVIVRGPSVQQVHPLIHTFINACG